MIREKFEEIRTIIKEHKKTLMVVALFVLLACAMWYRGKQEAGAFDGVIARQSETGSSESRSFTFRLEAEDDGEGSEALAEEVGEQEFTIEVSRVEPDEDEAYELMEEAYDAWKEVYLGENSSANEVRYDLCLPSEMCDGLVTVSYESSDYSLLGADGTVTNDDVGEEGSLTELTAEFSCGEHTRIETEPLLILPPRTDTAEWLMGQVEDAAVEAEESSRLLSAFYLPEAINGYRVIWS
ncbi:MAG: hypothetical protein LUC41_05755, partial [Clostridiales bacterium]|nr:hypothetical protein [Clostridiales bacterium]